MQTSQIPGGIQPHSMGSLFPAVIARVERYETYEAFKRSLSVRGYIPVIVEPAFYTLPLRDRLLTTRYELTLGDFCEEYATYKDAEQAARGLLEGVRVRNRAAMLAVLGAVVAEMTQRRFLRAEEC